MFLDVPFYLRLNELAGEWLSSMSKITIWSDFVRAYRSKQPFESLFLRIFLTSSCTEALEREFICFKGRIPEVLPPRSRFRSPFHIFVFIIVGRGGVANLGRVPYFGSPSFMSQERPNIESYTTVGKALELSSI